MYVKVGNTVHETDFTSLENGMSKLSEVYSNSIYSVGQKSELSPYFIL